MTRLQELLTEIKDDPYSYIGREWDSVDGRRKIIGVDNIKGKIMLAVRTGDKKGFEALFFPSDIEHEIAWETKYLAAHLEALKKQAVLDAKKQAIADAEAKEREHLDRFLAKFSPMARAKLNTTLTKVTYVNRQYAPMYKHMESLVREGYSVTGAAGAKRRLAAEDGRFFFQKDLTKSALDYAYFLTNIRHHESVA